MNILTLLGINPLEFEVHPAIDESENEIIIYATLKDEINRVCPNCKSHEIRVKDFRVQSIRHQCSIFEKKKIILQLSKRRYMCKKCGKTFTQQSSVTSKKHTISDKVVWAICVDLVEPVSFSYIGRKYQISPQYIKDIFMSNIKVGRAALPMCLSIDEKRFTTDTGKYICVLSNARSCTIVDVLADRKKDFLFEYFSRKSEIERKTVKFFTSDMYEVYREVKKKFFNEAIHIVDPFHVSRLFTETIQKIRKDYLVKYEKGTKEYNFIKKNWKIFLINPYGPKAEKIFFVDKNTGVIYTLKEKIRIVLSIHPDFLSIYNLYADYCNYIRLGFDDDDLKRDLSFIVDKALCSTNKHIVTLGKTLYSFYDEILNYFMSYNAYKVSNASAESINSKIQEMITVSKGLRSFNVIKTRLLYSYKKVRVDSHHKI